MNERTPEADVARLIDATGRSTGDPTLLADLMREAHPVYRGRSTNAVIRMRGYAMAAFERVGLPDAALIYVIEELESGRDAYLVAAAAKALRGLDAPERRVVPFLFRAIENVRYDDDTVSFETYQPTWPVANPTTALTEIFNTFAWLGPSAAYALPRLSAFEAEARRLPGTARAALARAMAALQSDAEVEDSSCCQPAGVATLDDTPGRLEPRPGVGEPPLAAQFEDQDGRRVSYRDLLIGRPSVVVFFYTRCTNPNKCSLTITKLARLQSAIADRGLSGEIQTAAITYDPEFDLPARLHSYGENRGVSFDDHNRLLRTTRGFRTLSRYFGLGVNYGPAVVNRHRIEAFVLDDAGRITITFARLQWDVGEVLDQASARRRRGKLLTMDAGPYSLHAEAPIATSGLLLLADIGGYTSFLRAVEEAHRDNAFANGAVPPAYSLVSSLLDGIIEAIVPPFTLSKLEGDAVFAWAADSDGVPRGPALLAFIVACHAAFRDRLGRVHDMWTCRCNACARVDTLDLKFVLHAGPFVIQSIAGRTELAGSEVVMAHRLLKSGARAVVGHGAYALFTDVAVRRFDVPTEHSLPLVETYEHYPPVDLHVFSLLEPGNTHDNGA